MTVERLQYVCAAPDLSGRLEVWSATMTVGFDEDNDILGYDSTGPIGALSDNTFDYRGISYTLDWIRYDPSSDYLALNPGDTVPLETHNLLHLHLCSEDFNLADALVDQVGSFQWDDIGSFLWSAGITVSVALSAVPSSDPALSGLKLEESAGTAITLNQPFAFYLTDYTASVANSVSRVTVIPTARDTYATLRYLDGAGNALADLDTLAAGRQIDLLEGANTIQVEVTAEDGATTWTYTVAVTRAAAGRHRCDPERSRTERRHAGPVLRTPT